MGVYNTLLSLPWSFKFIFGMMSDAVPIFSYRRKSWYIIGWLVYVAYSVHIYLVGSPSAMDMIFSTYMMTCAFLLCNVCMDTIVVERARLEPEAIKGTLQTAGYTINGFGSVLGSILGMILYNTPTWASSFLGDPPLTAGR